MKKMTNIPNTRIYVYIFFKGCTLWKKQGMHKPRAELKCGFCKPCLKHTCGTWCIMPCLDACHTHAELVPYKWQGLLQTTWACAVSRNAVQSMWLDPLGDVLMSTLHLQTQTRTHRSCVTNPRMLVLAEMCSRAAKLDVYCTSKKWCGWCGQEN